MNNFKQFLFEIANPPSGYGLPTDRTKFSLGDIVLVIPTANWKTYQSKRSSNYFNKAGTVVGYKNVPGAYSKFALEFPDGTVEPFHGHFLYGPFLDIKTAEKYDANTIANIDVKDIKGANIGEKMQTSTHTENTIKNFFCNNPFNFKWLDSPIELSDDSSTITILATLPKSTLPEHMKLLQGHQPNLHTGASSTNANAQFLKKGSKAQSEYEKIEKDNFIIFRFNNARNKKLKKIPYTKTLLNFEFNHSLIVSYGMTFFTMNSFNDKSIISLKERLKKLFIEDVQLDVLGLNANIIQEYVKKMPRIEKFLGLFNSNWDTDSIVDFLYDVQVVNGEKILKPSYIHYNMYLNKFNAVDLKDYVIDGQVEYDLSEDNEKVVLPKKITKQVIIQSIDTPYTLTDFSFLQDVEFLQTPKGLWLHHMDIPKIENFPDNIKYITINKGNLKSLYGLPKLLKYLDVSGNDLKTLDGDVETVEGPLIFNYNPIVKIGANSPTAESYIPPAHISEKDLEKALKDRDRQKLTSKETESEFGDFFSEL